LRNKNIKYVIACIAALIILAGFAYFISNERSYEKINSAKIKTEYQKKEFTKKESQIPSGLKKMRRGFSITKFTNEISLDDIIAQINDMEDFTIHNRANFNIKVQINPEKHTITENLLLIAKKLDKPLIGDIDSIEKGSCLNAHITLSAVYAGNNEKILDLLDLAGASSPETRLEAIEELAEIEEENIEPLFIHFLEKDENEEVRASAAASLEDMTSGESVDALIRALSDPSDEVREHARTTLCVIGEDSAAEKLKIERERNTNQELREIIDQILEQSFNMPLEE
jgi:HEAT repeat protein